MFKRATLLRAMLVSALMLLVALVGASAALAGSDLSALPAQLEFGQTALHYGANPAQGVTISDGDPLALVSVESVSIEGPEAAEFQIAGDGCSGTQLENLKGCTVEVEFRSGGARGAHTATLALATSQGPLQVPLSGSDITGTLSAQPDPLSFSPIPYTAPGTHSEGENTETETVTLRNGPEAPTLIESASISGPDASSFSIQWNCDGVVLATGNSCNVGVRFQPTSLGPKSASLTILSDSATPLVVPLEGAGLHGPAISLSSEQSLLGNVTLGSSKHQTLTVSNGGDYPLFIQRAFLVSGTPLMFPVLSDSCSGQILYPQEACSISLAFRPTALGEKSASILFITNTPAIAVAGFDGVGVAPQEASPALSEATLATSVPPSPSPTPLAPAQAPITTAPAPIAPVALSASRPARLYSLLGRLTLDPGADLQCPAAQPGCEALAFVLAADSSSHLDGGFGRDSALLGSALSRLRGGQGTHVRIPLSQHLLARLRSHGHLLLRVAVLLQANGTILAQHTWTVRLSASGAATRLG